MRTCIKGHKSFQYTTLNKTMMFNSTLDTPDIIMVLFFLGDFSFCFADSLNCRMAASATGSLPFNTSSSEKKGKCLWWGEKKKKARTEELSSKAGRGEVELNFKKKNTEVVYTNCMYPSAIQWIILLVSFIILTPSFRSGAMHI